MKIILDKLKQVLLKEKRFLLFIFGIIIIAFISGSIFTTILSNEDKTLVTNYISDFINKINADELNNFDIFKNTLFSNTTFLIIMWVIGISIIGIPLNIFLYFTKFFVFGFSISSFILNYGIRGCLISFVYVFPHQIINLILYTILLLFSINFSKKIIILLHSKKTINFQKLFKQYIVILFFCIICILITSIIEAFLIPSIINKILFIIK